MNTLNNLDFKNIIDLQKVTFNGTEEKEYDDFHIKTFYFEQKSQTGFKFRMVFRITHFLNQNRLTLSVLGQEKIIDWHDGNGHAIPDTGTICNWTIEDFDFIVLYFLNAVEKQFPGCEFRMGYNMSGFINRRIEEIKQKNRTAS